MTTLVVGATGQLGSEICRQLRAGGKPVRALVRAGSALGAELEASGIQTVAGDLKDPDSLAAACRGATSVVTTANTMMSRRRGDSFRTVEARGQAALLRTSERNGVRRFV